MTPNYRGLVIETFPEHGGESGLEGVKPGAIVVPEHTSLIQSYCQRAPRRDWGARVHLTQRLEVSGHSIIHVSDKRNIHIKHKLAIIIFPLPKVVTKDPFWNPIWRICEDSSSNQLLVILVVC